MNSEERLRVALHVVADNADTPPAPVAELIRRGRRSRRGQVLKRSMVAVGVVAAVGGTTTLTVSALGPRPAQVAAAPVDVASAAEGTGDVSFRFTHTGEGRSGAALACHGALDPGAEVGWETGTGADRFEVRFVDGTQYVKGSGKPWRAEPRSPFDQSFSCPGPIAGNTVDPVAVVRWLREKGPVEYAGRTGTGPDAIDTYTFHYSIKAGQLTYSGELEAGVAARHVQRVIMTVAGEGFTVTHTIVYSGFGEPVQVTRPVVPS